jgi:hypothetical protein
VTSWAELSVTGHRLVGPKAAASRDRVPQATSASSRIIGYPVPPLLLPPLRCTTRLAGVSGQHIMVPSMAHTSRPRHQVPRVPGPAAGVASGANSSRNGAATGIGPRPATSRDHTCRQPHSANNAAASST